jgi:hypothetical protein
VVSCEPKNFSSIPAEAALATLQQQAAAQAGSAPAMKITRIDTTYWRSGVELPWKPNWVWVRVYTDSGLVGLGETYPRNEVEASLVHSTVAGILLGRDPRDIERIWADLYRTFDFQVTGGAEMRTLSAIGHRSGALGPAGEVPQPARLSPPRREVKSRGAPLQHLFHSQVRLRERTGKNHARADRPLRDQADQDMTLRPGRSAQPA